MRPLSASKTIRLKCLDCAGGAHLEVRSCAVLDCVLWRWRLGLNPNTKKNRTNRFLCMKNFEGMHNRSAREVVDVIEGGMSHGEAEQ
jgi:hypothetical protein